MVERKSKNIFQKYFEIFYAIAKVESNDDFEITTSITNKLKQQEGGDIIAYGGAKFVSALVEQRLIDDFHLYINPTAIGSGMPIFKGLVSKQEFTLLKATSFACGIVVLQLADGSVHAGFQDGSQVRAVDAADRSEHGLAQFQAVADRCCL